MLLFRWFKIPKQYLKKSSITTSAVFREAQTAEINKEPDEKSENNDVVDPKDRSRVISVETSIKYMKSSAFFKAYGDELVWKLYRRNFKGHLPPRTRKTCIRGKRICTGSPCPICRDEYLVVHYKNVGLLKQFVSPYNNILLPSKRTGVCQRQHRNLAVAVEKAKDYGLLTFEVPFRYYFYKQYIKD